MSDRALLIVYVAIMLALLVTFLVGCSATFGDDGADITLRDGPVIHCASVRFEETGLSGDVICYRHPLGSIRIELNNVQNITRTKKAAP